MEVNDWRDIFAACLVRRAPAVKSASGAGDFVKLFFALYAHTIQALDTFILRDIIIFMNLNMMEERKLNTESLDAQTQVFKILTHPARIAILYILRDSEHCVCHMEACLGFRQSYISQQLALLREAGIIQDRRVGWNIFYRVVNPNIYEVLDAVRKFTGQTINPCNGYVVSCNCPHCIAKRNSG